LEFWVFNQVSISTVTKKVVGDVRFSSANTDTDSEWIFKSDGLVSKNGDDTKTLSFSDEWIRVVMVQIVQKLLSPQ
jgi:hypothetical protein